MANKEPCLTPARELVFCVLGECCYQHTGDLLSTLDFCIAYHREFPDEVLEVVEYDKRDRIWATFDATKTGEVDIAACALAANALIEGKMVILQSFWADTVRHYWAYMMHMRGLDSNRWFVSAENVGSDHYGTRMSRYRQMPRKGW